MLKNIFLSEKKLLNAILRAKPQAHEKCFFYEMNSFLQCRRPDFHVFEAFLQKKSF